VKTLNLSFTSFGNAGLEGLLRWPLLSGVRRLDLEQTGLTTDAALALAECPALADLRGLSLMNNRIGAAGCLALAHSAHLKQLTDVWLNGTPGTKNPAVQKALRERFKKGVSF
jgi:hypothetical protein